MGIEFPLTIDGQLERTFESDLKQTFEGLGLAGPIQIDWSERRDKEHGDTLGKR